MRLSVSNIAWDLDEEEAVAALLQMRGVDRVDVAPGKYFIDPLAATDGEIAAVRRLWRDRGFAIAGMQSLLFGATGLNLFSDADGAMVERLSAMCRIAGGLGAPSLTFGSPKQRDRTGLDDAAALAVATDFFGRLGEVAARHGVLFCLEANPAAYGCNFMTTTDEAAAVVAAVADPNVRLQLDIGAIAMNAEPVAATIAGHAALIGHVHASEPQLAVLGDAGAPHAAAAAALRQHRPDLTVTVEMAPSAEPRLQAVARALDVAEEAYGA